MEQEYQKLFATLPPVPAPSAQLLARILERVQEERLLQTLRWRVAMFGGVFALAVAASISILLVVNNLVAQSGALSALSLLFMDSAVLMSTLGDYVLLVLETIPVVSVVLLLVASALFIWSADYLVRAVGQFGAARRNFKHS